MTADSRVVGSSSGSAAPTGVIRTQGQSSTNNTSSTEVGKKTADELPLGAIDPVALKARTQANLAQYFNAVSTPAAPTTQQQPQNSMAMLAGFIGPGISALTSMLGSSNNTSNGSSNGNNRPNRRPNTQDIAQNTPRDNKETKDTKDPKIQENTTAPEPPKEDKKVTNFQLLSTENIS